MRRELDRFICQDDDGNQYTVITYLDTTRTAKSFVEPAECRLTMPPRNSPHPVAICRLLRSTLGPVF